MTKPTEISPEQALDRTRVQDPYPSLERLRAQCPVAHQAMGDFYLLFNYEDVRSLLKDPEASRDPRKGNPGTYMRELNVNMPGSESHMLFVDPPQHTRLRGLVSKAFTPRAIERLTARIKQLTDELLDAIGDRDRFDLMEVLATPLPTIVIAELLGVDPADHPRFKRWALASVRLLDIFALPEEREAAIAALEEFTVYLEDQIAARRRAPRDDLFTALLQATDGDDRLTDEEVITTCRALLSAGNLTTTDLIGNAVAALLEHPDQLAKLR